MIKLIYKRFLLTLISGLLIINFTQAQLPQLASVKFKVGLLIVATGKYIEFVEPLIKSANQFFCKEHDVTYFIFTDGNAPKADNIVSIYQKKLAWPYATMMRYATYANQKKLLQSMDYLYACDADMLFVDEVGSEILSQRVATLHPAFSQGSKGTPEHRSNSTAYIKPESNKYYYAGGFVGGSSKEFLKLAATIQESVEIDLEKGLIAIWHDESHLNRYYLDNQPTLILSPSYCYWQYQTLPYKQRLVALYKNHAEYQK